MAKTEVQERSRATRPWLLGGAGGLAVAVVVLAVVVLAGPRADTTSPSASTTAPLVAGSGPGTAAGASNVTTGGASIGTAVGDRPPDFTLTGTDGQTISRDSLIGTPALLWFTTSYCVPCQQGALDFQRVLDEIGDPADELAVVIVFVDGGEPADALEWWQESFGRPDWTVAFSSGSMVRDFRLAYLDTKYLLDRDGIIMVADFVPLQVDPWVRDVRSVLAGAA